MWPWGWDRPVSSQGRSLPLTPGFPHLQAEDGVTWPKEAIQVHGNPSDAADAKSSCGLKGRMDKSRGRKAFGATKYLEINLVLESPRAGNTSGDHWRDVYASLLFPALPQTLLFS